MAKIWFLGEALIDFVPTTSPDGPAFAPRPGGSPFNAAKAAAQAGAPVGFLGAISTDLFGERLMADLEAHGVDGSRAPRPDDPCTLAFVALEGGAARYAFYNRQSATALMAPDPAGFTPGVGDILSFGSISLIDLPGADNIASFALAHAGKAMVAIDPNARPTMTPDPEAWRARIASITDVAGVIKLSDEDLDLLAPGVDADTYAAQRLAGGAGLVVVTHGDRGAVGYGHGGTVTVPGRPAQVVDTVGAGDTLMGSVLAELVHRGLNSRAALTGMGGDTLGEILTYGVTAAALNCEASGCAPPPRQRVLDTLRAGA